MSAPRVVLLRKRPGEIEKEIFGRAGITIDSVTADELQDGIPERVYSADAILLSQPADREFLSKLKKCRVVGRYGLGYDNIDVEACTDLGIAVVVPRGYGEEDVADHSLAFILAWHRRIVHYDRLRQANDPRRLSSDLRRLSTLVAGLCGFGGIGRNLALKLQALGMRVLAYDPYVKPEVFEAMGVERVEFEDLLAQADVISIHSALTPETYHLFDEAAFRAMKKKPLIVNTARGSIISTEALVKALDEELICGACLDVLEGEHIPVFMAQGAESEEQAAARNEAMARLRSHPNVILTPLIAYQSTTAKAELPRRMAQNVVDVLEGWIPEGLVNPQVIEILGLKERSQTS
ncbi:MAG: C-terminal binding protein [Firmicutes bacterium]|nr:C-terminal binding protein [Bacillota bacterium]